MFIGFEPRSPVSVGRADDELRHVIDLGHVLIPFQGIRVISDNMPHRGVIFEDNVVHSVPVDWKSNLGYHIKGFMAINDIGAMDGTEQRWFHEGCEDFVQRRPPPM